MFISESILRRSLALLAAGGLLVGLIMPWLGTTSLLGPEGVWAAVTIPVIILLSTSMVRDFLIGRIGVDAIALVAMTSALVLGQSLAAAVVALMYAGGTVLEDFARGRAERNLRLLADRSPRIAHRRRADGLQTIAVAEVAVDDELYVRAGELIPVDGELLGETAKLDESAVTGEPLPVTRLAGDCLRSGTINAGDAFVMRASALASASTYAAIVRMVAAAQTAKAPFTRLADRFALILLPLTLIVAAAAWLASADPMRGLAVLVVATPCPLILAAPVAFLGGVSRAAREGVLMKGSAALEGLARIDTVVFDKTGTLTRGGADLLQSEVAPGRDLDDVLRLLASVEQASHHVVADAVLALSRRQKWKLPAPTRVQETRGSGLEGAVEGRHVRVGSLGYVLSDQSLPLWAAGGEARFKDQPVLRVYVAVDGLLAGVFTFGDALRADAQETVTGLRRFGVRRIVMLTGDDEHAAARVAARLPLDQVISKATPADKVAAVRLEMARGATMMVGDGINDAPALASATIGVAMAARGATASSEAADVVLLTDRLAPIVQAVSIAQRSRRIALQSVVAGLVLSGVGMMAAAFGAITPVQGALLQEGIDVAVIVNALRALKT